jgi:prophage antirepressor-like protein
VELFTYADTHRVRAFIINGRRWAVAADICAVLELANPTKSVARVDAVDKAVIRRSDTLTSNQGIWESFAPQVQQVGLVSENGATDLILESRKPEARNFRRWLTHEVWPSIRDTGSYGVAALDLSDPIAAIEAAHAQAGQAIEVAKAERARAEKAEKQVEIEQRHRRAIEGGDGILLTDFGKKYFSEVRHTDFFEHLYAKKWLIDQRGTRLNAHGEVRDGHDHRKPTYKGRPYIYEHDTGTHGGQRRFQSRVRPQREIELRDALAAEGLPVNMHSTGLVLITNDELKGLGAGVAS